MAIRELSPPGSIHVFGSSTTPKGFIKCDGSSLNRVLFKALFDAIGTTYGAIDGNSFSIPDLRGFFTRGRSSQALGTVITTSTTARPAADGLTTNSLGTHTHSLIVGSDDFRIGGSAETMDDRDGGYAQEQYWYTDTSLDAANNDYRGIHQHTANNGGDLETSPINLYVQYMIKF